MQPLPPLDPLSFEGTLVDIDHYLRDPYEDIGVAGEEIPICMEWLNVWLQNFTEQKLVKKQQIKEIEARVFFRLKSGDFTRIYGGDKMSEKTLERAIALDDEVKKANEEFAVLSGWVNRMINLMANMQTKLDLLRTFEATKRKLIEDTEKE